MRTKSVRAREIRTGLRSVPDEIRTREGYPYGPAERPGRNSYACAKSVRACGASWTKFVRCRASARRGALARGAITGVFRPRFAPAVAAAFGTPVAFRIRTSEGLHHQPFDPNPELSADLCTETSKVVVSAWLKKIQRGRCKTSLILNMHASRKLSKLHEMQFLVDTTFDPLLLCGSPHFI